MKSLLILKILLKKRMQFNKNDKILVVAAHPDDEVLGCGGSMAKWTQSGDDVHILILAEGATARDKKRDRESLKCVFWY